MDILSMFLKLGTGAVGGMLNFGESQRAEEFNDLELRRAAHVEDLSAVDALVRGSMLAGQIRSKGSQLAAQQKLAYTASGVDASVGTALDVAGATGLYTEMDATTAMNNAVREAWGHQTTSQKYERQRVEMKTKAHMDRIGGWLSAAGGAAGSIGSTAGSYLGGGK